MTQRTISSAPIPLGEKVRELTSIFLMFARSAAENRSATDVLADVAEYEEALRHHAGLDLFRVKALEIGFGARPLRLFALAALGTDVSGVDLDVPLLSCSAAELHDMYRRNGAERVLKSLIRFALFDLRERRSLDRALRQRRTRLEIDGRRLRIGDAAALETDAESLDLIFAEDVFEHIPPETLRELVPKMARWLRPSGLALIRPNVFTGIAGGHLAEWFPHMIETTRRRRKSEPWEHLRLNRFHPNTYLNKLCRADYRTLFRDKFEIVEERVRRPNLGREYLTPETALELEQWGEEELFSNQVLFVMKPRTTSTCRP